MSSSMNSNSSYSIAIAIGGCVEGLFVVLLLWGERIQIKGEGGNNKSQRNFFSLQVFHVNHLWGWVEGVYSECPNSFDMFSHCEWQKWFETIKLESNLIQGMLHSCILTGKRQPDILNTLLWRSGNISLSIQISNLLLNADPKPDLEKDWGGIRWVLGRAQILHRRSTRILFVPI